MRGLLPCACALLIAASPASADDSGAARVHYLKARAHHEKGAYQPAAAEYLQAYSLFPDPELLFNVAQVYRLAGDEALASGYYRRYLELDPRGRAAPEARRHLETMGKSLPGGSAAAAWGDAPGAPRPVDDRPRPAPQRGWMRWTGLASAGTGVLLLGIGAYYGIEARGISAELSLVDRWTAERLDRFEDGERAENRAIALSVAGGVLVAGGAALYIFAGRQAARPVEVAAAVGPGGELTVAAAGRF